MYTLADEALMAGVIRFESIPLPPLTGDYNNNGIVDAADYVVWRKTVEPTSGGGAMSQASVPELCTPLFPILLLINSCFRTRTARKREIL
jgi:hypothetical protein